MGGYEGSQQGEATTRGGFLEQHGKYGEIIRGLELFLSEKKFSEEEIRAVEERFNTLFEFYENGNMGSQRLNMANVANMFFNFCTRLWGEKKRQNLRLDYKKTIISLLDHLVVYLSSGNGPYAAILTAEKNTATYSLSKKERDAILKIWNEEAQMAGMIELLFLHPVDQGKSFSYSFLHPKFLQRVANNYRDSQEMMLPQLLISSYYQILARGLSKVHQELLSNYVDASSMKKTIYFTSDIFKYVSGKGDTLYGDLSKLLKNINQFIFLAARLEKEALNNSKNFAETLKKLNKKLEEIIKLEVKFRRDHNLIIKTADASINMFSILLGATVLKAASMGTLRTIGAVRAAEIPVRRYLIGAISQGVRAGREGIKTAAREILSFGALIAGVSNTTFVALEHVLINRSLASINQRIESNKKLLNLFSKLGIEVKITQEKLERLQRFIEGKAKIQPSELIEAFILGAVIYGIFLGGKHAFKVAKGVTRSNPLPKRFRTLPIIEKNHPEVLELASRDSNFRRHISKIFSLFDDAFEGRLNPPKFSKLQQLISDLNKWEGKIPGLSARFSKLAKNVLARGVRKTIETLQENYLSLLSGDISKVKTLLELMEKFNAKSVSELAEMMIRTGSSKYPGISIKFIKTIAQLEKNYERTIMPFLQTIADQSSTLIKRNLLRLGISPGEFNISSRVKGFLSLMEKLRKKRIGKPGYFLEDLIGIRVVFTNPKYYFRLAKKKTLSEMFPIVEGLNPLNVEVKNISRRGVGYYYGTHINFGERGIVIGELQLNSPLARFLADWTHDTIYKPRGKIPPNIIDLAVEYASRIAGEFQILEKRIARGKLLPNNISFPKMPKILSEYGIPPISEEGLSKIINEMLEAAGYEGRHIEVTFN